MEEPSFLFGKNLKRIREERKLSLGKLAELTGVSKSMLGQIERGVSSPTIATVGKISNGLKISFITLLNPPQPEPNIVRKARIQPGVEDKGRYRLFPLFPIDDDRRFEIYTMEIEKGGYLSADTHPEGTQEFLVVYQGELIVRVDDQEYLVPEGDGIRLRAGRPHTYHNAGEALVRISLIISYL